MQVINWQPTNALAAPVASYSSLWYSFPKLSFPAAVCRQLFEAQLPGSLQNHGLNGAQEKGSEAVSERESRAFGLAYISVCDNTASGLQSHQI